MDTLLLAAWIGCQSLDLGTTLVALSRPGFHEANPVMRGPHLAYVKVSVNIGAILWNQKAVKKRYPTGFKKRILPLTFASIGCLGGGLNLRILR